MNVAKTTYRAALVAAALSCLGLALPAHADNDDRRPRYSREHRDWSRDHRWTPPGHRYEHRYRKGYRHGYRDGRRDDRYDRRYDRRYDGRWDRRHDRWHGDRHWRGGYYDRRYYDRGWYGSSYWYDRYPRHRWHDGYDGDVEFRVRIPF